MRTKVLISMEQRLLTRVDQAAEALGLSRSAYLARLAEQEVGAKPPGRDPKVRHALRRLDRLFRRNGISEDPTAAIRAERDAH